MICSSLNDKELLSETKALASEERRVQAELLLHLLEIEKRKLFLEIGYGSLFDYVTKELSYSESAAYRRIQAMRLLKSVPDLENKILKGEVTLTTAAQVQSFVKSEEKRGVPVANNIKTDLLETLTNKSTREVEKHLLSLQPSDYVPPEKVRQVTDNQFELRLIVPDEIKARLDELKLLLSHVNPNMTYLDLIDYLSAKALKQLTPHPRIPNHTKTLESKSDRSVKPKSHLCEATPAPEVVSQTTKKSAARTRYIPASLRKQIWLRDGGCCSYVDLKTGRKCQSKFQVQTDHIYPYALGGSNELSNLRLLCASHNRLRAQKTFKF